MVVEFVDRNFCNRIKLAMLLLVIALINLIGFVFAELPVNAPNIILVMTDDMGYGDVGFNGMTINGQSTTPHLDQLVSDGVKFTHFYSGGPVCSPTRATCLTGRHYWRHGIWETNVGKISDHEITIPGVLQSMGYATAHFGKWHNGIEAVHNATVNVPGSSDTYNLTGDDSRIMMDQVIPFMQRSVADGKPFFAVVWFHTPHKTVAADPKWQTLYEPYVGGKWDYHGSISGSVRAVMHRNRLPQNAAEKVR